MGSARSRAMILASPMAARAPRMSTRRWPRRAPLPGVAIPKARFMPSRAASSATRATAPGANTTRWDGMSWVKEATMRSALALRSELGADLAIERIGPAAAQRNGETDEAPEQRVFVAAVEPGKSVLPVEHGDDQHLDRRGRGEKAGEQAENERDPAAEFDEQRAPDPGQRRIESALGKGADVGGRPPRHLAPAVHQQVPADRDAHHRPGERDGEVVERLQPGNEQLRLVPGFLRHDLLGHVRPP